MCQDPYASFRCSSSVASLESEKKRMKSIVDRSAVAVMKKTALLRLCFPLSNLERNESDLITLVLQISGQSAVAENEYPLSASRYIQIMCYKQDGLPVLIRAFSENSHQS